MTVSRRDLLALLLGAPLAAQACQRPFGRVPGAIRGDRMAVGHRLRDPGVTRTTDRRQRVRVVVVGAGASGLSAGYRLARGGVQDLVLLDVEEAVGGTSSYATDGVVPYPWAAHYLPLPLADNRPLLDLLEEMGVVEVGGDGSPRAREGQLVRAPQERVFCGGQWHEGLFPQALATARDLEQLERFDTETSGWAGWRDAQGRRAFALPLRHCSDDAQVTHLDRLSAAQWLDEHGYDSPLLRWYVEYACRDDYGTTLATTSAWAMLFYFASRVSHPGAPAAPFLTWPEGNGRLVRHLLAALPSPPLAGQLVTDVAPTGDRVEVAALDVRTNTLTRYVADQVVLAVPRFVAGRVLRPWREAPPAWLADFTYAPWVVANLHLRARPPSPGFPMAWDNVVHDSPALGYVVATHQQLRDHGPTVWTYYLPLTDPDPRQARQKLTLLDHGHICDAILGDLGRAHDDLRAAVERIDVWRWGHAMVRPVPGFIWGPARRRAAAPVGRVHFAHTDLSGMALFEEAFDHGVTAAESVLRALGEAAAPISG